MNFSRKTTFTAAILLAIASVTPSVAQNSTRNVGGNNVGGNNIGGNNIGGGGGGTPSFGCANVTLAQSTQLRACQNSYTARLGNIICSGNVRPQFGSLSLSQGPCNQGGNSFLGGTLTCNGGLCTWTPSPAGFAQGYQIETIPAYYN
ncbi:MAG: hypothetical protein AAF478_01455 [Pseudomonadota bacterium]